MMLDPIPPADRVIPQVPLCEFFQFSVRQISERFRNGTLAFFFENQDRFLNDGPVGERIVFSRHWQKISLIRWSPIAEEIAQNKMRARALEPVSKLDGRRSHVGPDARVSHHLANCV